MTADATLLFCLLECAAVLLQRCLTAVAAGLLDQLLSVAAATTAAATDFCLVEAA